MGARSWIYHAVPSGDSQTSEELLSSLVWTCRGIDNLLYSADADFSCFADLAITSPVDYYRDGQGSLLQCVLTPADPYMPLSNEEIAARVHKQVSHWLSSSSLICLAGFTGQWLCAGR